MVRQEHGGSARWSTGRLLNRFAASSPPKTDGTTLLTNYIGVGGLDYGGEVNLETEKGNELSTDEPVPKTCGATSEHPTGW